MERDCVRRGIAVLFIRAATPSASGGMALDAASIRLAAGFGAIERPSCPAYSAGERAVYARPDGGLGAAPKCFRGRARAGVLNMAAQLWCACQDVSTSPSDHSSGGMKTWDQAIRQECESSRVFTTFFMVSRYGSETLPFATHHGTGGFCLARDEQRTPRPGLKQ